MPRAGRIEIGLTSREAFYALGMEGSRTVLEHLNSERGGCDGDEDRRRPEGHAGM